MKMMLAINFAAKMQHSAARIKLEYTKELGRVAYKPKPRSLVYAPEYLKIIFVIPIREERR
jgi:hypothetical protein